jgi:hypothetical protein
MVAAELITRGRNIPGTQHRRDALSPFFQWTQSQDTNLASYVVDGLHWLLPEDLHCMVPNWPHPRTSPILGWDILIDFHFLWIYLLYSILFIKIGSILQMSLTKKKLISPGFGRWPYTLTVHHFVEVSFRPRAVSNIHMYCGFGFAKIFAIPVVKLQI